MSLLLNNHWFRLILLIVVGFSLTVNGSEQGIFTCCKLQSTLDSFGYCDQPTSEFDLDTFPSQWKVPEIFLNNETSDLVFNLQPKPTSCLCGANTKIRMKLYRAGDESEWILRSGEKIEISKGGTLYLEGKQYARTQYCLQKLNLNHCMPWERERCYSDKEMLDIEVAICSESCQSGIAIVPLPDQVPQKQLVGKSPLLNTEWLTKARLCSNNKLEMEYVLKSNSSDVETCKWAYFYFEDGTLSLIELSGNIHQIQDRSYPWELLSPEMYCKAGENTQLKTGIVKFCISEIKKLFYYLQEVYAILAGVSGIFLLFNLTIYFALRESLSISGWTEFLYSSSLYTYCVLSIPGLLIVPDSEEVGSTCYALAVVIQFFELANGATLVALSFDIFWTFCKYDKASYTDDPKVSTFRLTVYFIFSVAFPLAIVCYGISKNHRPDDFKFDDNSGIPQYGLFHCTSPNWPMSTYTQFTMQGINLLLVLISAYVILNKRNGAPTAVTKMLGTSEEESYVDPDRMDIFSKLFVFVFLFWIVDFLEFFYEGEVFTNKWYSVAFHIINYSQGVFAFFILVCNRKTLRGVRDKDWNVKNLFRHACCTCSRGGGDEVLPEEAPLSPLMKSGSFRRATVRGNTCY